MSVAATVGVATGSLYLRATYFAQADKIVQELENLLKPTVEREREAPGAKTLSLSTSQTANALGVSLGTIRRWADMGVLESYRTPGGQRRFSVEQIEQFLENLQRRRSGVGGVSSRTQAPSEPVLHDVAAAVSQTERYIRYAEVLSIGDWPDGVLAPDEQATFARSLKLPPESPYRLVTVRMGSPLEIVLHLSPEAWTAIGFGLVLLAERICTFGPRVSRRRKRALLEATIYDEARKELLAGRADGLALSLLSEGPPGGPTRIDFLDPEAPSDEPLRSLERWNDGDDADEGDEGDETS
jgi:excisionase family DNA binding protein